MIFLDIIKKYLKTLSTVGFIRNEESQYLILYLFLTNLNARIKSLGLADSDIQKINSILSCLKNKSCILRDADNFTRLTPNQAWVYGTSNNIYFTPDNLLVTIGDHVGAGVVRLLQDGQLVGSFNVNQDNNVDISFVNRGENIIKFSKPTTTEYFKGDIIPSIEFAWDFTYPTTEQKCYINNSELTNITSSTKSYIVNNVSGPITFKVTRKNYDNTYVTASRQLVFYDRVFIGSAKNIPTSINDALNNLFSIKAKTSTNAIFANHENIIIILPSSAQLTSVMTTGIPDELLDSPDFIKESGKFTYNNIKYDMYHLTTSEPFDENINIKITV